MLNCEASQNLLADSLFEPLSKYAQQRLDTHLAACDTCRELQAELIDSTLQLQNKGIASAVADAPLLDNLWARLQPELNRIDAQRYHKLVNQRWQRWVGTSIAMAACLLFAVGFFLNPVGITTQQSVPVTPLIASRQPNPEFQDYLNRAQTVLLTVANTDQTALSSMPLERNYAGAMATEAKLLSSNPDYDLSPSQAQLLQDLEHLLLQFANFDEDNLAEGLAILKLYLQDNTILFRMNLAKLRQQSQPVQPQTI